MSSAVVAAVIGVSGTVVVGVAGLWATVRVTGKTVQAGQDARLWERRAAAYVDAVAAVQYRRMRREHDTRTYRLDDESERRALAELEVYTHPEPGELVGRLLAFGSMPVVDAMQATGRAHDEAIAAFQAWKDAGDEARAHAELPGAGPPPPGQGAANTGLLAVARKAVQAADDADDALIKLIRAELQGHRPQPESWRGLRPPDSGPGEAD
jgi:hypothetical protein